MARHLSTPNTTVLSSRLPAGLPSRLSPNAKVLKSIRSRMIAWIMLVVFTALSSVLYLTDAVRRGEIHDSANKAVEQEISEFNSFVKDSPTTYTNARQLIEAYLTQELPQGDQILLGVYKGRIVQQSVDKEKLTNLPKEQRDQLLKDMFTGSSNSGITNNMHWARVEITTPGQDKPDYFATVVFTDDLYRNLTTQTQLLTTLGLVVMLIAVIIAWLIANQIINPIRTLRNIANQITDSDLTSRVPVDGEDEIADLAGTFNRMLDRIDTAYKAQRQFVDDAGHELRTPITVIRGHLELLDTATHEQRERSIKLCMDELDRMTRMVNDLLTLAIADADGPSFLHMQPIDLTELTIDIEDKADMVSGGRAKVTEIAEGFVLADAQRITEAILELTRNAVKYTNDDSPIIIGSTNKDGQVGFSVRDFGPGIDNATQEILFHRFNRGEQSPSSDQVPKKGAGLGLSIVKVIAEAHGGHAWVDSTPGLGSTFGITFPATIPPIQSEIIDIYKEY
ncbi:HAMP domain-containing sensor histidine kinase [uncultured Corynebacterium sp.]|jgi:ATPase/histidine kinase/DNA gyrase B/HSP90 domain protein|uniref:sensor histidine kinase n=1 Tax=uncultured Corynebacterium sp. TaxID=159447 RepID=UPI0028D06EB2|nr:HAMP domain-containing sensor histidine kinase [uncultured Corynebacterium sp.]